MRWLRRWLDRRAYRKTLRLRLDQEQARREAIEAVARQTTADETIHKLMRSAS